MDAKEKLEGYFVQMGLKYQQIAEGTWVVTDDEAGIHQVVIMVDEPVVVVRVTVMPLPTKNRESFFETVLRMNAGDLVHIAYAIEGEHLILSNSFILETLDLEEIQAAIDEFGLALIQHYSILSKYRN
jgi:Putative bacterial sensory transduction regulator